MYRALEASGDPQPHPSGALSNTSQRFRYSRGLPASSLRSSALAQWFLVHAARQTEAESPTVRPSCDPPPRSYIKSERL
jgi:hypothetical protein